MNKFLINFSFVIATIIVVLAFMTATTYAQLTVATALYPLLIFLLFKAFPRSKPLYSSQIPLASLTQPSVQQPVENVQTEKLDNTIGITDIDKRVFLKLIGGVGLSLFLFSIFNKKAESLFFKSVPSTSGTVSIADLAGNKIDPAQNHPTDGYRISEIDDNVITFYGFTNKDGGWFMMKEDSDNGSFRYAKGDSDFPINWNNRETLKYDYFNNVF